MKKYILAAAVLVLGIGATGLAPHASAAGYSNQTDIDETVKVHESLTAFVDETNDPTATTVSLKSKAGSASDAVAGLIQHDFSTNVGKKYTEAAGALKEAAQSLKQAIDGLGTALDSHDQNTIQAAFGNLENKLTAYDDQMEVLNNSVESSNSSIGNTYLYLLIATVIIAGVAFAWAFSGKTTTDQLKKAKRAVAYSALAPVAGAAITYVSFLFAEKTSGTYWIAWGPVVIGVIVMIRYIGEYLKLKKTTSSTADQTTSPVSSADDSTKQ